MPRNIVYKHIRRASIKLFIFMLIPFVILVNVGLTVNDPFGGSGVVMSLYFAGLFISFVGVIYAATTFFKPHLHRALRRLKAFGPPEELAARIDEEVRQSGETMRLSLAGYHVTFSPSWIIWSRGVLGMSVRIINVEDIAWVYQRNEEGEVTQYSLVIHTRDGAETDMNFFRNKKKIGPIIQRIEARAPWIISGYSEELERVPRQSMVAEVNARRAQY